MRIVYGGKSILLTGDMVGRHESDSDPEEHVIAAEEYLIENRHAIPIDSDVYVASHHGGNDASSYPSFKLWTLNTLYLAQEAMIAMDTPEQLLLSVFLTVV